MFILLSLSACFKQPIDIYQKISNKTFEDIQQDAEFAITERNFRITNRLHIGSAIKERSGNPFPRYEVILFCNLSAAEHMLKISPKYINYCPYKITIAEHEGKMIIGTRLLPTDSEQIEMRQFSKKINHDLRLMVEYAALEDWFITDQNNLP